MGWLLFCNADSEGNLTESLFGKNVIPDQQYDYFFFLAEPIEVGDYMIIDGKLSRKEA